jgi:vesicular inhibitory amino acid transporter
MDDVISLERHTYQTLGDFDDIDDGLAAFSATSSPLSRSRSGVALPLNKDGVSNSAALFHVICVIAGTGILQLPYALSQSGWIGVPMMILAAFVNEYTGRLLIDCLYINNQRLSGYPEIGYVAYGELGRAVVNVFYNSVLLGVTTLYLILSGMDLASLVGYLSESQWYVLKYDY